MKIINLPYWMIIVNLILILMVFVGINPLPLYESLAEVIGYSICVDWYFIKNKESNIGQKAAAWALLYNNFFNLAFVIFGIDRATYLSMYANIAILSIGFIFTFYLLNKKQNADTK